MKVEESGRAYASLGTRKEGRGFEDVGLSLCALPLQILVLRFQRSEIAEEGTEEFTGSIQCNLQTEELPPQHAELYTTAADT